MSIREVAERHYTERKRLAESVGAEGRDLWRQVDRADLSGSWSAAASRLAIILAGAQAVSAGTADAYVDQALAEIGIESATEGTVVASPLSGEASDGRDLRRLLMSPVVTSRIALGRGATMDRALASGMANLEMILRTQVADAGRVADGIAVTARPRVGYVRQVTPPSCPRCAILAGRWYRWSSGFQRHSAILRLCSHSGTGVHLW